MLALLSLLCSCGSFGITPALDSQDSGLRSQEPVYITEVDPNWGSTSGGTEVTLHGWGLDGDPLVTLGTEPAEVLAVSDSMLVIATPPAEAEGIRDISVISDLGSFTLPEAFIYSETDPGESEGDSDEPPEEEDDSDPPDEDTDDDDTDYGVEGTVGMIQIYYQYNLCPDCFIPPLDEEVVSLTAAFFDPVSYDFLDHLPPIGSCVSNLNTPTRALNYLDAGSFTYLISDSRTLNLYQDLSSSIIYTASTEAGNLQASELVHASSYDLRVPGGSGFDAVELEGAAQSAQFFTSVLPDIGSLPWAYSLSSRSATEWSWTPSGSGSMLISYDFYNSAGSYTGSSICHGSDTGYMTVPASAVTASSRSYVSITLMRLISGSSALPQGRGDIFYTGAAVVMGSGMVQ